MIRKNKDVFEYDANSDLHDFFVARPRVHGFATLYVRCSVCGGISGTRKTARTLKDAAGKAMRFETLFPKGVFHCYEIQVQLNADYEAAVNRRIATDGMLDLPEGEKFEASPLPYGEWDLPGLVIMHHGGWHLRTSPTKEGFKPLSESYVDCDGEVITPVMWDVFVQEFKEIKKESAKQASFGLLEEDQVLCRNYKFESIQEIHVAGIKLRRVGINPLGA